MKVFCGYRVIRRHDFSPPSSSNVTKTYLNEIHNLLEAIHNRSPFLYRGFPLFSIKIMRRLILLCFLIKLLPKLCSYCFTSTLLTWKKLRLTYVCSPRKTKPSGYTKLKLLEESYINCWALEILYPVTNVYEVHRINILFSSGFLCRCY